MKSFDQITVREILAVAISSEEEDGRPYADFVEGLREDHPNTAQVFSEIAAEEDVHRHALIDLYSSKCGNHNTAYKTARHSRLRAQKEALAGSPAGH